MNLAIHKELLLHFHSLTQYHQSITVFGLLNLTQLQVVYILFYNLVLLFNCYIKLWIVLFAVDAVYDTEGNYIYSNCLFSRGNVTSGYLCE